MMLLNVIFFPQQVASGFASTSLMYAEKTLEGATYQVYSFRKLYLSYCR